MSTNKTVAEWAAEAFRPCCGTCRAPMLNRKTENLQSCSSCGAHWNGSEASEREASFRARGEVPIYWRAPPAARAWRKRR